MQATYTSLARKLNTSYNKKAQLEGIHKGKGEESDCYTDVVE